MTPINTDLIPAINDSLEIDLPDDISLQELKEKLAVHINHLISHDFEKLVSLLYRVDVNEKKMRGLLDNNKGENAAALIADLIIERQLEKIKSRRQFRQRDNNIDETERW